MKPSIGRIVHVAGLDEVPVAAIITKVWSDVCISVRIFPDSDHKGGDGERLSSIMFSEIPNNSIISWNWPPKI